MVAFIFRKKKKKNIIINISYFANNENNIYVRRYDTVRSLQIGNDVAQPHTQMET